MTKTVEELLLGIIQQLKEKMKYCDKSVDIRVVESALKKIMKALKRDK